MHIGYRGGARHLLVAVHRQSPGHFEVDVDDSAHAVEVLAVEGPTIQLAIDGAVQTAYVIRVAGAVHVWIDGQVYVLAPESAVAAADHGALAPPQIVAPMPGKVLQVLVAAGQQVATGDGLVIVEAMKMEHRITAAAAASVRAVHVVDGQMVDGGALLVELDYA
jgi:3-methylcrotonyl-CoA carboxylase alpha subunit